MIRHMPCGWEHQEEAGPHPDHMLLMLSSRRPPQPWAEKAPWRPKGSQVKDVLPRRPTQPHTLAEMCARTREDPEIQGKWAGSQARQGDWPKEETPTGVTSCHRATQGPSL